MKYLLLIALLFASVPFFPACTNNYQLAPLSQPASPSTPTSTPSPTPICEPYVTQWSSGSVSGFPRNIAIDTSGTIYVAIENTTDIEKFTNTGTDLGAVVTGVSGPGIAVDSSGNIYVCTNSAYTSIRKYSSTGTYITGWGDYGTGPGQFGDNACSLAIDSNGNINATDPVNNRVEQFTTSGSFILQWGSTGTGNGQFSNPSAIAADTYGNIYVNDQYNGRVEKFSTTGTYLSQIGNSGLGLATDSGGNVYIGGYSTTYKYNSSGALLCTHHYVPTSGLTGPYEGTAVDSSGYIYEADSNNATIFKFGP